MSQGNIINTSLEGAEAARPEAIANLQFTTLANSAFFNVITGFGDVNDKIVKMKGSINSKYQSALGKRGYEQYNALGIQMPDRIKLTKKRQVQITRAGSIPDTFSFTSANYTAAAMNANPDNFEVEIASPGGLISNQQTYQFVTDSGAAVQFVVNTASPTVGGGSLLKIKITSGTVVGDTTNSSTAKTIKYLGTNRGEGSAVQPGRFLSSSTEIFKFGKHQESLICTPESENTTFDTLDELPFPTTQYIAKSMLATRAMNNAWLIAKGGTLIDESNNAYNVPEGVFNMSGITNYDANAVGLGPTILDQVGRDFSNNAASPDCPWEIGPGGLPILHVFADEVRCRYFDNVLRTSTTFGTSIQNRTGESTYDAVLDMYKTRYCWYKVHYENTLDGTGYASKLLIANRNTFIPVFKEGFFYDVKNSPGDTTSNMRTDTLTSIHSLAVKLKTHVAVIEDVTALEGAS